MRKYGMKWRALLRIGRQLSEIKPMSVVRPERRVEKRNVSRRRSRSRHLAIGPSMLRDLRTASSGGRPVG